jgi:hypothetical protein
MKGGRSSRRLPPVNDNFSYKNMDKMKISIIAETPRIKVHIVCVLYPCSGVISPKLVTTQK